jgi:hypothetical protein
MVYQSHYPFYHVKILTVLVDIGEVWANMLHNVYAELVKVYGFDAKARSDPTSTKGNAIWLHLMMDALALQPCNPTRKCVDLILISSVLNAHSTISPSRSRRLDSGGCQPLRW